MCELFALSSRIPTTVSFCLEKLARRGGWEGPHRDGWGVAFYEGPDVFLLREPRAAAESELVRYIERHGPPSELVVSHIRRATHGERAIRNTQPFMRELGGRVHVFGHNGKLDDIGMRQDLGYRRFRPLGDTDSERAFCALLERLVPLWDEGNGRAPALAARLEAVARFAADLREIGPANFLYADGDALFLHGHRRRQHDDVIAPPGLHIQERILDREMASLTASGVTLEDERPRMVLAASVPLTGEPWRALAEGEVMAIRGGRILASLSP